MTFRKAERHVYMEYINAKGIIVYQTDFNEADRMLTVLTDSEGIISVKAAGIRSLKRHDLAGAKPFIYGDYILTRSGDHYGIKECNIINAFLDITKDLDTLSTGCYILDIAGNMILPGEPSIEIFRLTLNSIFALNQGKADKKLLKAAYEMKICDLLGYTPHTFECMECFEEIEGDFCYFDLLNGGILCKNCCSSLNKNILKISTSTIEAINYVIDSDIKAFLSFKLNDSCLREFSEICEKFFLIHSGHTPKTLDYLKEMQE